MGKWNQAVKAAREARGLSKAELARRVGVSPPTVTDWESGKIRELSADSLLALSAALEVPPWDLYGRRPPRGQVPPHQVREPPPAVGVPGLGFPADLSGLFVALTPSQRTRIIEQMRKLSRENLEAARDYCARGLCQKPED